MKKKSILAATLAILLFTGILLFIKVSNDHQECESRVEQKKDQDGNMVVYKTHVCREQYNF